MNDSTHTPLVSVVTPAFNSAAYLQNGVRSVLRQTCSDFELLIVDDGSNDSTLEVARRLMAADGRIRAWAIPHGGPAVARNAAIARARGRFIALLDSDDEWSPRYLEEQLAVFASRPDASVVTANAINRGGAADGRPIWAATTGLVELRLRDIIAHEDAVCIMSVFRRDVVDRAGGFDPVFTGNEDYEFWLRAAAAGCIVLQNRRPLGFYQRRAGSVSADDRRMLHGLIAVLIDLAKRGEIGLEDRLAIQRQLERFCRELATSHARECFDRGDARAAVQWLRTGSRGSRLGLMPLVSAVAEAWPGLLLWLYEGRRAIRDAAARRRPLPWPGIGHTGHSGDRTLTP